MREVKFRGYATEEMVNDQWMNGTGIHKTVFSDEYAERTGIKEEWFIFTESGWVLVKPKSIGQYTGLKDLNDNEIFEGDVLVIGDNKIYIVYDEKNAWFGFLNVDWVVSQGKIKPLSGNNEHYEIIGNIFENPELLD